MNKPIVIAAILSGLVAGPSLAAVPSFALSNGTGRAMSDVSIRHFGNGEWRPLGVAPANGARAQVSLSDPECAFDIRAQLAGGITAIWSGVNLCEVRVVTLRRDPSGELWVDYD